jgi:hypothetical protein
MALENFAECYAIKVETTVDSVIADLRSLGAEGVRSVVNWWSGLSDVNKDLIKVVAPVATGVLVKILEKALNATVATGVIALLGGASWALLILAFTECVSLL